MITYEDYTWDDYWNTYYDVEFTEDIGVFKTGETFSSLSIDQVSTSTFERIARDEDDNVIKKQKCKLVAI